jgi:hypothetical protein
MSPNPNQSQQPSSVSLGPGSGVTEAYADGQKMWPPRGLSIRGETRPFILVHSGGARFATNLTDDVYEVCLVSSWSFRERTSIAERT